MQLYSGNYVKVESGVSMLKVNTENICMVIHTLSETDNSVINSEALLLVVMVLV